MHIVITHVSPVDRRERIYAGWVVSIDEASITLINERDHKTLKVSELRSVIAVMTGEEVSFESLRAHLSHPK